jgi:uncharacterized protein
MLFDLAPKEHLSELYGRNEEVEEIIRLLKARSWIVVLGPRMVGKTSLVKVALNELSKRKRERWSTIYVNFSGASSLSSATRLLVEQINENKNLLAKVREKISNTESFSIGPGGISWSGKGEPAESFRQVLSNVVDNKTTTVVFFDEIQELFSVSFKLLKILKNIWDTKGSRILFVFSGSKFGMLRAMEKEETAMSGRPPATIRLRSFDVEQSRAFLEKGLAEHDAKLSLTDNQYSRIANELDGIVGWLTLFGNCYTMRKRGDFEGAMKQVQREGRKIVSGEFNNFLKDRDSKLCRAVLSSLSSRAEFGWTQIKEATETILGYSLNNNSFNRTLNELIDGEYVEEIVAEGSERKRYRIIDPLLAQAVRK